MPRKSNALLPRLLIDSVLPCALAAFVLTALLTLLRIASLQDATRMRISAQLAYLTGQLQHHAPAPGDLQSVLDQAMQADDTRLLKRVDVEGADGSRWHSGAAANVVLESHRRELVDAGIYRAIVLHVDPHPGEVARRRVLIGGVIEELGVVLLALLAALAMQRRVLAPLERLQHALDRSTASYDEAALVAESNREFAELQQRAGALGSLLDAYRADLAQIRKASAAEALERLQHDQAVSRGKAHFMALVGHHFRQPMQALQLLSASLHPGIDDEQQAVFSQMRGSIRSMTRLLDALLEISRLDAGVVQFSPVPFSVADLFLRDRVTLLELARQRQVTVVWHQSGYRLQGDIELAGVLLFQLVSNAIVHTSLQGTVLIGARNVDDGVRIEVRDNGQGIPAIHQQRIFEEFVQLHGEGERRDGYGLGLAIAERLARTMHSRMGLRSEPGRGSTFWFDLPRVPVYDRSIALHAAKRPAIPAGH